MDASHPEHRTPTFRQFVMVVGAVTWFAVLVPIGARATGQLVTVVDATTSTKAHVDADGKLRVGDGSGRITVDGTVGSYPAPADQSVGALVNGPGEKPIAGPLPANRKIAITSLTLVNRSAGAGNATVTAYAIAPGGNCFDWVGQRILANFAVPAGNMAHLTYPHPLLAQKPVRAGDRWCLFADIGSLQNLNWIGYAFTSP